MIGILKLKSGPGDVMAEYRAKTTIIELEWRPPPPPRGAGSGVRISDL